MLLNSREEEKAGCWRHSSYKQNRNDWLLQKHTPLLTISGLESRENKLYAFCFVNPLQRRPQPQVHTLGLLFHVDNKPWGERPVPDL